MWQVATSPAGDSVFISPQPGVSVVAIDAFTFMAKSVYFQTSSSSTNPRTVSYVLSNTTIASSTGGFIKAVTGRTFSSFADAQQACGSMWLYGSQGKLAYISSEADDLTLRAIGAMGWFGAAASTSNVWTWTQSQTIAGAVSFWTMAGGLGRPVAGTFSHWDIGSPVDASQSPMSGYLNGNGAWSSIPNGLPSAGVLCGFAQPNVTISGQRALTLQGCFVTPCLSLTQAECASSVQCVWAKGTCSLDNWCYAQTAPTACNDRQGCNWDYDQQLCLRQASTACAVFKTSAACNVNGTVLGCSWNATILTSSFSTGACLFAGCGRYGLSSTCNANSSCQFVNSVCQNRTCGYVSLSSCWGDSKCMWNASSATSCTVNNCALQLSSTACGATDSCLWNTASSQCNWNRCSSKTLKTCLMDSTCLFANSKCFAPTCSQYTVDSKCNADPNCFFYVTSDSPIKCQAAQCTSQTSQTGCDPVPGASRRDCVWTGSSCRQATTSEMYASAVDTCEIEIQPNLWWLWLCLGIILLLLIGICFRLYLAHSQGLSFLDPVRTNVKYSPHAQFAADLFEESKATGVETNYAQANPRPGLQDL